MSKTQRRWLQQFCEAFKISPVAEKFLNDKEWVVKTFRSFQFFADRSDAQDRFILKWINKSTDDEIWEFYQNNRC